MPPYSYRRRNRKLANKYSTDVLIVGGGLAGVLFSGDTVYDGPLLDQGEDANIANYIRSIQRLRDMPVSVVHGGHDPSFDRDRLVKLCDAYIRAKGA